jgi:hypothetical protein
MEIMQRLLRKAGAKPAIIARFPIVRIFRKQISLPGNNTCFEIEFFIAWMALNHRVDKAESGRPFMQLLPPDCLIYASAA